jgi:hypothetical protein
MRYRNTTVAFIATWVALMVTVTVVQRLRKGLVTKTKKITLVFNRNFLRKLRKHKFHIKN